MPSFKRQNTIQIIDDLINNNFYKVMYPTDAAQTQSTIQKNNDDSIFQKVDDSPTRNNNDSPSIFKIPTNFPFDEFHLKPPFSFHSKIQRKDKMINSKKLFLQQTAKYSSQNNSNLIDRSKLKEIISTINNFKHSHPNKQTGRKRKLQPDSEDIASLPFQAKLIKTAIDDQSNEGFDSNLSKSLEFDSKLNLRDNVVDVFNLLAENPKIAKSLKITKYCKIPLPTLKNINEEIDMLLHDMIDDLSDLKNSSKYSELKKYCVILKSDLLPYLPNNYKDLLIQAIGQCNV